MKELYLYSGVYDYVIESLLSQMEDNKDSDITIRMNTDGGDVQATWGLIAKMKERSVAGKKTFITVDGKAISAGFFLLAFASKAKALNVSYFLIHRAAFSSSYEKIMTEADKADLAMFNLDLRKALESKIDPVKFASMTGVTFDQLFDLSTRIDVTLNATQALALGLIDEIVNITESQVAASKKMLFVESDIVPQAKQEIKNSINTKMEKSELKEKFPALYAELEASGVTAEKERVKGWMVFNDVDSKAVAEGIASGKEISTSQIIELTRKSVSAASLKSLETESPKPVATTEAEAAKLTAQKELEAATAAVYQDLGLKK